MLFHLFVFLKSGPGWTPISPDINISVFPKKDVLIDFQLFSCHSSVFENKDKIVIVMEYASKGELYDYISERRRLSERETRHFFRQIVSAVHHCHKVRNVTPHYS